MNKIEQRVREFAFGIMELKGKELDWEVRDEIIYFYDLENRSLVWEIPLNDIV